MPGSVWLCVLIAANITMIVAYRDFRRRCFRRRLLGLCLSRESLDLSSELSEDSSEKCHSDSNSNPTFVSLVQYDGVIVFTGDLHMYILPVMGCVMVRR